MICASHRYYEGEYIKVCKMGGACGTREEKRNAYRKEEAIWGA